MMTKRVMCLGVAGAVVAVVGCAGGDAQDEAIETATTAAGLACVAWTPVQSGTLTIGDNRLGVVSDGDFVTPFYVGDGYAFKIEGNTLSTCPYEEVKIFAHLVQGGPEVELAPLRFVTMPNGSRIWVYKPDTASSAVNITDKVKGPPGSTCGFMTMTCTTEP